MKSTRGSSSRTHAQQHTENNGWILVPYRGMRDGDGGADAGFAAHSDRDRGTGRGPEIDANQADAQNAGGVRRALHRQRCNRNRKSISNRVTNRSGWADPQGCLHPWSVQPETLLMTGGITL